MPPVRHHLYAMGLSAGMGNHYRLSRVPVGEPMTFVITPHANPDLSRAVQVEQCNNGIEISISGYGKPLYLELDARGEPVLHVTAESDSDDVSHTISLASAKETPPA
jgi:hypothetical protein